MEDSDLEVLNVIRDSLSRAFEVILGSNGLYVLKFHLERRLGADMYGVFYENPHRFYKALEDFLGGGADALTRLIFTWLIENGYLENEGLTVDDYVRLLKKSEDKSRNLIVSFFIGVLGEGVVGGEWKKPLLLRLIYLGLTKSFMVFRGAG